MITYKHDHLIFDSGQRSTNLIIRSEMTIRVRSIVSRWWVINNTAVKGATIRLGRGGRTFDPATVSRTRGCNPLFFLNA